MLEIVYLIVLILSLAVLSYSSEEVVKSAVKISKFFGIRKMAIGLILIAMSTTLPELSISVTSSIAKEGAIAAGNVFGSNIANVLLILGVCSITFGFKINWKNLAESGYLLVLTTIISAYILFNSTVQSTALGLMEGVALLLIFVIYVIYTMKESKEAGKENSITKREALHAFLVFCAGIIIVIISSGIVVDSAINIVKMVGITESFIGSTIIAIGTSLPELSIAIQSTRKRHYDLAIGNIIGSNMANITLILGTAAVIAPLNIKLSVFITALIFAIVANILLFYYVAMARKLEKKDGILFLATYLLFLITIFFLQAQEM